MGVLYAKVSGQWVPVAPAGSVIPPAYAGYRSDSPTQARFGHLARPTYEGMMVGPDGALTLIVPYLGNATWYQRNSADNGYQAFVQLKNGYSTINGWGIGQHPVHAPRPGLWADSKVAAGEYSLLAEPDGTIVYVNASSAGHLRVGNADIASWDATQFLGNVKLASHYQRTDGTWAACHLIAWNTPGGSNVGAGVCIHQEGYWANVWRVSQWENALAAVNSTNNAYVPVVASAFNVGSSVLTKHDVRPLTDVYQRDRIIVRHDPRSDTVPPIDVMSLRPVAFRPNVGALDVDGNETPHELIAHEGRRERLGLIAEEVETVIPSAVSHGTEGNVVGIDYAQITVALLEHVQRLTEEVATLRYRVAELEGAPA